MDMRWYMRHRGYSDVLFSEFVYDFESRYSTNHIATHTVHKKDTQMELQHMGIA